MSSQQPDAGTFSIKYSRFGAVKFTAKDEADEVLRLEHPGRGIDG